MLECTHESISLALFCLLLVDDGRLPYLPELLEMLPQFLVRGVVRQAPHEQFRPKGGRVGAVVQRFPCSGFDLGGGDDPRGAQGRETR